MLKVSWFVHWCDWMRGLINKMMNIKKNSLIDETTEEKANLILTKQLLKYSS